MDVIFPVLHGTFGEDGTIQGLLELADIPYVGAGVLGSAAGMDKDIMKALFRAAGLPIVKHVTVLRSEWDASPKKAQQADREQAEVSRVREACEPGIVGRNLAKRTTQANSARRWMKRRKFDRKIVIEQGVGRQEAKAREIECSVLGNDQPAASVPGRSCPSRSSTTTPPSISTKVRELIIPAKLTKAEDEGSPANSPSTHFRRWTAPAWRASTSSWTRKTRKMYVNEINTMPGFTSISMYPKLWAASGIAYPDLIDRLIQLGLERHAEKKKNQYSR